jgi:hypothetical protein
MPAQAVSVRSAGVREHPSSTALGDRLGSPGLRAVFEDVGIFAEDIDI